MQSLFCDGVKDPRNETSSLWWLLVVVLLLPHIVLLLKDRKINLVFRLRKNGGYGIHYCMIEINSPWIMDPGIFWSFMFLDLLTSE